MLSAVIVFALGLWMWLHVALSEAARGAKLNEDSLIVFMMWVLPPFVVVVGSYLQCVRINRWAVVLVVLGGVSALPFVALNALFAFGYTGHSWGVLAVNLDVWVIVLTIVAAIGNAVLKEPTSQTPGQSL